MKTPFPYFGSKEVISHKVWDRLGKVDLYIEPFFGSGRVLFNCPYIPRFEVINDANLWVANFWRSCKQSPQQVAEYADYPISEIDQHSRGDWLYYREDLNEFKDKMLKDPEFCDPKSAGWWVWGMSQSIMGSFVKHKLGFKGKKIVPRSRPQVCGTRSGVCRKGLEGKEMLDFISDISNRLRYTSIMCGDWIRAVDSFILKSAKQIAIFFDPPYGKAGRSTKLYGEQDDTLVSRDVMYWCKSHEDYDNLRIAFCGYDTDELHLKNWSRLEWNTGGGMNNTSKTKVSDNKSRERIWFSKSCLSEPTLYDLFSLNTEDEPIDDCDGTDPEIQCH
jgi:site-specific DNA-adenine methylase